jgi:creatinine amidohydrolase
MEFQWNALRSTQFNRAKASEMIVILPIGSTEQHGPHLPVQTDTLLATEVAHRAAALCAPDLQVLVLPALWVSLAEHHMALPGTLTLDHDTLVAFIRCIVRSVARQGYRRIFLLNGHGGNINALASVVDQLSPGLDLALATATYWVAAAERFANILEEQKTVMHACEAETSMLMHLRPDLIDVEAARTVDAPPVGFFQTGGVHRWRPVAHWSCSGVVGVPRLANAKKGAELLAAASEAIASALREFDV